MTGSLHLMQENKKTAYSIAKPMKPRAKTVALDILTDKWRGKPLNEKQPKRANNDDVYKSLTH